MTTRARKHDIIADDFMTLAVSNTMSGPPPSPVPTARKRQCLLRDELVLPDNQHGQVKMSKLLSASLYRIVEDQQKKSWSTATGPNCTPMEITHALLGVKQRGTSAV